MSHIYHRAKPKPRQTRDPKIKTRIDARLSKAGRGLQCYLTPGKEYVRCYKYETENVLLLLPTLAVGCCGASGGEEILADDGWIEQLVGDKQENICVLLRKVCVSVFNAGLHTGA